MASVVQSKPYTASAALTGSGAIGVGGAKILVGAHNLHTSAQTATILITDANGGANLGLIPALGIGAFYTPPAPGITVPSGSFTATPSTTVTGNGVIFFFEPSA